MISLWELIEPLPKQVAFLRASLQFKYLLYGGARGPGKSYILRWGMVWRLLRWAGQGHENVRVALFCEDYPALKQRQITKIRQEFPDWLGSLKQPQDAPLGFYLRDEYGAGGIWLLNLDDPSKYQSAEYAGAAVDELTKNDKDTFDYLRGSLRWPGINDTFFWGATNPGGKGHVWVKSLWMDGTYPKEMEKIAHQFRLVKALPTDNPYLTDDYWLDLLTQPPDRQRAWILGDWDVFAGQYFSQLNRDIHGFNPADIHQPKGERPARLPSPATWRTWRRFRSYDWGWRAPASLGWWAVDPEGNAWRYRELYKTEAEVEDFMAEVLAAQEPWEEELIEYTVADPSLWDVSQGPSIAERAADSGVVLTPAERKSDTKETMRVAGWSVMRRYVDPDTRPMLYVAHTCRDWWRTVPGLVHDEHRVEDLDSDGEDHAADDTRYFLTSRPEPTFVPAEQEEDRFEPGSPSWVAARARRLRKEQSPAEPGQQQGREAPYEIPGLGRIW